MTHKKSEPACVMRLGGMSKQPNYDAELVTETHLSLSTLRAEGAMSEQSGSVIVAVM